MLRADLLHQHHRRCDEHPQHLSLKTATDGVRIEGLTAPARHIALLDLQGRICDGVHAWSDGALMVDRAGLPSSTYLPRVVMEDGATRKARQVFE